jgi:hypothetical protein
MTGMRAGTAALTLKARESESNVRLFKPDRLIYAAFQPNSPGIGRFRIPP